MGEFSKYINYCANQFNGITKCESCPYGRCIHESPTTSNGDCYSCLNRIHRYSNQIWKYQCERIIYNYVLKFGHRYASEIDRIMMLLVKYTELPNDLNVYSVGCGPCTELFGVFNQLSNKTVHYKGFDISTIWQPLNDFQTTLFPDKDVQFLNTDIFEYSDRNDDHIDILILHYMLSDLARFESSADCSLFVDKIVTICEEKRVSFIIINDVYLTYSSRTGYALMEELARKLQANKIINEKIGRGHFADPNPYQPTYGKKYANVLTFPIIEASVVHFQPFPSCGSIFMIVHIQ